MKAIKTPTITVNNLTTKTCYVVRSTKNQFIKEMNNKPNCSLEMETRTGNGWYIFMSNGTKLMLEIIEN